MSASSLFGDADIILLSRMNQHQLAAWLQALIKDAGPLRGERTMMIIRQLQIALARYSKNKPFDRVQDKMLAILAKLEKWLRLEFVRLKTPEYIQRFPKQAADPERIKRMVLEDWERFFKMRSY